MGIRVALSHRTSYKYDRPVIVGPQIVRLRPALRCRTPILSYSLDIKPARHFLHWQQDPIGNHLARVVIPGKTDELSFQVQLTADLSPINPLDLFLEPGSEAFPFSYSPDLQPILAPYLETNGAGPLVIGFLDGIDKDAGRPTLRLVTDVNRRVHSEIAYLSRSESGIQTPEETLARKSGSCRDSAWLLITILRSLGLAARFVSGYLIQLDVNTPDSLPGEASDDHAELHAWAEVYLPGAGWIGLDATSGLLTTEGHIPLASAHDPTAAAPVTGTVEPAGVEFSYSIAVHRVESAAQRSDSITDRQWSNLRRVAEQVDADLATGDVRLTMGGEPTFVGIDNPDSPEWNVAALGDLKRERAVELIKRLRPRFGRGALLHFGQGKWYPGELLPRWALSCFWRADSLSIWENEKLIADETCDYGYDSDDALTFLQALSRRLQVSEKNILGAYEDALYYIWRERKLPVNVDVFESKLGNASEREELVRVFTNGLKNAVGYALPLRRRQHNGRIYWSSQLWFLRPPRVHLLPGDSPIGFRLPLDSLPWVEPDRIEYDYETDPFETRNALPLRQPRMDLFDVPVPDDPLPPEPQTGESAEQVIRPALSVEARQGRIHVFLPYTTKLPDYLDLIAAVEDTAAYLNIPVCIEGYTPPSDPRLRYLSVTPDPGVIEVNLQPAANWQELEHINTVVAEEARASRLVTEKFLHDGRHAATGGGNHIVLGGATAADSPLLRRPDLLRSMVAFWQNHPSLSYLFSGAFIGPTSQYPRVDEARMDSLYELEIAFSQLPSDLCPPWLVDRLFRNLLVDATGNTHRAEFCIDKLYPPEGFGSRLGLLELRAFEMAPDLRMGLAAQLLIRALVAVFWKEPYQQRLVRWGTRLHDQFLLPHYVASDFEDVLTILNQHGYAMEWEWFRPQFEFRFPKLGSMQVGSIHFELRQALEP
ncbi:MAG: transglutaminase family protein, partial [Acidobacteriaceae bacterium]|nr:transglutaminase family protein [Acidobacteriaceae bacterium]